MSPRPPHHAGDRGGAAAPRVSTELAAPPAGTPRHGRSAPRLPLAIVGPTAVGKTALAVDLCRALGGEIVSIDSRQAYRGIPITSNAPTRSELQGVACHMVGVLDPAARMNAASYVAMARPIVDNLGMVGRLPVLTAGTGLYLRALLDDLDLGGVASEPARRAELEAAARRDLPALVRRLRRLNPAATVGLDVRNPSRVVRRMEIALARLRALREKSSSPARALPAVKVGLDAPRPALHAWIEARVDRMLQRGWRREVERLIAGGIDPRSQTLSGIGVAELADLAAGRIDESEARVAIIKRTRDYARRQLTWFKADPEVRWFDVTALRRSDIVERVASIVKQ